jgi:peptidoglycan/xylan/chitin deacetylase (PgdA/CDA1 family)
VSKTTGRPNAGAILSAHGFRAAVKRALCVRLSSSSGTGLTSLIYHRVGGRTADERDVDTDTFRAQMRVLARHRVVDLEAGLRGLDAGSDAPKVVITFDDGFADVAAAALPILVEHGLPFTLYLSTGYVGGLMHWDGSTATAAGPALTWDQLETVMATGLCTIGNHTHTHVRPDRLGTDELDQCTKEIEARLGVVPHHFAYPWGVPVPHMEQARRDGFRSAATGDLGRNHPGDDQMRLRRIPVRGSDPLPFFEAKLSGSLLPERAYDAVVRTAKAVGLRA